MGKWKSYILLLMSALVLVPGGTSLASEVDVSAEAAVAACEPYGPWAGAAYNPQKLMKALGQPRTAEVGPFLSAHRGAWGTDADLPQPAPENSLTAIDNAAALRFEMVELDVKLTSDGKLALLHDYTAGRVTDYSESMGFGSWNPFFGETHDGYRPQDYGDWGTMNQYNPLVKQLSSEVVSKTDLILFDKNSGYLGTLDGADAIGQWVPGHYGQVPMLEAALNHIGTRYPGMTVVIDLRHLDEVKAAIQAIDNVTDCTGRPAKDWVILKPFANVFKGGWFNAENPGSSQPHPESVAALIGSSYTKYKWIPVVSNRLVPPNAKGDPSIIPGSPGPDTSQIMANVTQYLRDWARGLGSSVVTFEIGVGDFSIQSFKDAYNQFAGSVTNMQSWRPPDVNVEAPLAVNGRTLIGFNWKDDGTGAYPVYKESSRSYEDTKKWAGALTIEDPLYVLNSEMFTRQAAQLAISDVTDFNTNTEYAIVSLESGKALDVSYGSSENGTAISIWTTQKLDNQLWRIQQNGDGTVRFVNPLTNKSLDLFNNDSTNGTKINLWETNSTPAQRWRLQDYGDGTYKIQHAASGKVLDVYNGNTANGTKVQIWESNGGYNQRWRLVPVETYMFYETQNLNLTMGLASGSGYANAELALSTPYMTGSLWRTLNNADGTFRLVNIQDSLGYIQSGATVVDTMNRAITDRTKLLTAWLDQAPSQHWSLLYNKTDKSFTFRHPLSGKVIDISDGNYTAGTRLILFNPHEGNNQRWFIKPL
ncbi:RICIN domain-containing protein [Cohnella thailandensis]|uniref:RICIN domain-containing protein n=1 Tax=Cohnella thailandensis TaxID=557557 RepID=A0A841SMM1_9BACL|nr:RICIN domain-containing protein [Cohnella thailandensis]MBB6633184.1 RICIN domain-containing protein [Cohnella thailandensis]MBP1975119.1 glycerophosphoryl diester phosphodiesterase [Cohnella thailandensis]